MHITQNIHGEYLKLNEEFKSENNKHESPDHNKNVVLKSLV